MASEPEKGSGKPDGLVEIWTEWFWKSNWISKIPGPYGTGPVVSPREFTYNVTCHQ